MTYRQIACLWERYWERKVWNIEVGILTNPMASMEGEEGGDSAEPGIDATTDEGISKLESLGLPIKRI